MCDLKPCPFCGCNAGVLEREQLNGPILYKIVCNSKKCRGHDSAGNVGSWMENGWRESREEAAELWNRRAERTCRDNDYMQDAIKCSECGEITLDTLYWVESSDGLMTVEGHRPRFCSNCGARVIDDGA